MLPAAKPPPLGLIERNEIQPSGGRTECPPHARLTPQATVGNCCREN